MRTNQENTLGVSERRSRQRLPLHWNVYLFRKADSCPRLSRVQNLSNQGFYCIAEEPFPAGEHVYCDIVIPAQGGLSQSAGTSLHCWIEILRVEPVESGGYGLACRIEEYSVSRWKPRVVSPAGTAKLC